MDDVTSKECINSDRTSSEGELDPDHLLMTSPSPLNKSLQLNEEANLLPANSLEQESSLVISSLENEVEVSIVEENGKQLVPHKVNGITTAGDCVKYYCSCAEIRPPLATVPPAATLYCQAVDSVGGKLVGCCLIANRKKFYRPSKKIPFMILCDSHRDRIRKHFCCPGCGLFCTQVINLLF